MDERLLSLRTRALVAGQKHDQALILCGDLLMLDDYAEAERAVDHHTHAAKVYGLSLADLALHLSKLEQTTKIEDEGRRVEKILDLLDREVEIVTHRLELMKNHR